MVVVPNTCHGKKSGINAFSTLLDARDAFIWIHLQKLNASSTYNARRLCMKRICIRYCTSHTNTILGQEVGITTPMLALGSKRRPSKKSPSRTHERIPIQTDTTRLFSILIHAHHRGLESSQRFEETLLHLTYAKRAPPHVVHTVQGILRKQRPSKEA